MKSNTHKFNLNEKVTVFDQDGIITEVIEESKTPYLYEVTFDKTQKHYIIEAGHIEHWKDPRPITERVKTYEDACDVLDISPILNCADLCICSRHPETAEMNEHFSFRQELDKSTIAYLKLCVIAAALNEGWKPEYTEDERRWYPWHYLYTKDEIDAMSEEDKEKISLVLWGGHANNGSSCGLGFAFSQYAFSPSSSLFGSRLAVKSQELARYFGKQFIKIWNDFLIAR